jgi:hypothetical protein
MKTYVYAISNGINNLLQSIKTCNCTVDLPTGMVGYHNPVNSSKNTIRKIISRGLGVDTHISTHFLAASTL